MSGDGPRAVGRRAAIKRLATVASGGAALAHLPHAAAQQATAVTTQPVRTLTDPDLVNPIVPWPRLLTADELRTVAAVCDVILPADERSPAPSKVGVPDFIDEWVSAPYPEQLADCQVVRGGLAWLDIEAGRRFRKRFAMLATEQQQRICDDIAFLPRVRPRNRPGAIFFERMRFLCLTGFYTTDEGMKDVQFVGNVPSTSFEGPPPSVLAHLKLTPRR